MVKRPRYAFFTDDRGVVYCEQVDHSFVVLSCLGHTMGGQATRYTNVLHWEGNESKFLDELKDFLDRGFTIERDQAYMVPNVWGAVKVIKEVTDAKQGAKLRKLCREGTPEAITAGVDAGHVVDRDMITKYRPVQPFTQYVLDRITGKGTMSYETMLRKHEGVMTDADRAYLSSKV